MVTQADAARLADLTSLIPFPDGDMASAPRLGRSWVARDRRCRVELVPTSGKLLGFVLKNANGMLLSLVTAMYAVKFHVGNQGYTAYGLFGVPQ